MSFIEREIQRINKALIENPESPEYDRLYVAQQALAWTLEPTGVKSPYDMVMGIQEETEGHTRSLYSSLPSSGNISS
jgi:hypothetical protein